MDDRDRQHLLSLLDHAQAAIGYARAHGHGWWKNPETLDAVLMRLSQVGEAASKTSPAALAEIPGVIWREVKGIRAKIVHDYQMVDVEVIRGVVSRQLPRLITTVREVLAAEQKPATGRRTTPSSPSASGSSAGAAPQRSTRPARRPPA